MSNKLFRIEIIQPEFDELYEKYKNACDIQTHLTKISLGLGDGYGVENFAKVEKDKNDALGLFQSYFDGKNETIKISSSVLEENGFYENFWEGICPQLQREGFLKSFNRLFPEYRNQERTNTITSDLMRLGSMRVEEKQREGIFDPLFVHDRHSFQVLKDFEELKKNEWQLNQELNSMPKIYTFVVNGKMLKKVQLIKFPIKATNSTLENEKVIANKYKISIKDREIWVNEYVIGKPHAVGNNFEFFDYVRHQPANTKIEWTTIPDKVAWEMMKKAIQGRRFIKILNALGFKGEIKKAFFYKVGADTLYYRGDEITKEDLEKAGVKIPLFLKELEVAHIKIVPNSPI